MKLKSILLQIILFGLGSLAAQSFVGFGANESYQSITSSDTLNILAVMVEFQEDNYDATIGNGKFGSIYTQAYGDTILDPLPHNSSYFSDHLEFAKNYYQKVSGGKLNVEYFVLPEVVTVNGFMRDYWPSYDSESFLPLANLAQQSWQIADQQFPEVNFGDYDLFILFHAGVSNSLDDGRLNLDRNLPSLYLGEKTFKDIFGETFAGFPVEGGTVGITNTIILPETESREYDLITGDKILQELTINGVIVTNIASHLGLPDLFDTATGRSRIGRLGLMDSQAAISNWGLFPPVPSAWEKIQMGWADYQTIDSGDHIVTLTVPQIAALTDTTILKVPISSTEYYLIENRAVDAMKDNIILKYKVGGQVFEKTVLPNTDGSYSISNDEVDGVLIDVDEYDASLPGDGIIIWHIDENVIWANSASNSINNDKTQMGVDVEEADGVQDIGEIFQTIFGDLLVGEGTADDFWYASNEAELYENKFSFNTNPSTLSNLGGRSNITIEDFSDISTRMSFRVKFDSDEVTRLTKYNLGDFSTKFLTSSLISSEKYFYLVDENGSLRVTNLDGNSFYTIGAFSKNQPCVTTENEIEYVLGNFGNRINLLILDNGNVTVADVQFPKEITAPIVAGNSESGVIIYLGFENGIVDSFALSEIVSKSFTLSSELTNTTSDNAVELISLAFGDYFWTTADRHLHGSDGTAMQFSNRIVQLVSTEDKNSNSILYVGIENSEVFSVRNQSLFIPFETEYTREAGLFSLGNVSDSGENSFLYSKEFSLYAISPIGGLIDNYPGQDNHSRHYTFQPLVYKEALTDNIITFTEDGRINVWGSNPLQSFFDSPITTGAAPSIQPVLCRYDINPQVADDDKLLLAVINTENDFYVWDLGPYRETKWSSLYGNPQNTSFVHQAEDHSTSTDAKLLVDSYNWPNPVYESTTHIRYKVTEDAQVTIRIFDMAGDLVEEISTAAIGGFNNESTLNVESYQSGIYFASLEVNGVSGKTESSLIKIAVIK
ncbi:MAG: T9SS type A sorting domain-containing protein [Bacteroidetes bacterium]|nr:T9SS type A sorting domain-containing protein [Bacteroidota bacterium]